MNKLNSSKDFEMDWESGTLHIGRNTLKNPLTVTVYGSGSRGIASKVTTAMLEVVYSHLSDAAREGGSPDGELLTLLEELTSRRAFFHPTKAEWFKTQYVGKFKMKTTAPWRGIHNPARFEFTGPQQAMLRENVHTFLVGPMVEAIEELMGGTQFTLKAFQAATQVQSAVLQERFQETVKTRLQEKRDSGELERGEFLSQKDYDAVFADLRRYGVVVEGIDNSEHHLNLATKGRGSSDQEFFTQMGKPGIRGKASIGAPSDAGVSVSPLLTISRGDAAMMVNFFASQEFPDSARLRTLPVFDGLEMPADGIESISEMINEALFEAWMENPAQDMADSFRDWLRQGDATPFEGLSSRTLIESVTRAGLIEEEMHDAALEKAEATLAAKGMRRPLRPAGKLTSKQERGFSREYAEWETALYKEVGQLLKPDMVNASVHLQDHLLRVARESEARKRVMRRVGISNDHMASGESPYVHSGEDFDGDLLETMQEMYEEELAKLTAAAETAKSRPAIEAPSKEVTYLVESLGDKVGDTDVVQMPARNALGMLSQDRSLAGALIDALSDFTFYFGTAEELTALRNKLSPEHEDAPAIQLGQTDLVNKRIFIQNQSQETILHEVFHAALGKAIDAHYLGLDGQPEEQKAAIENLEKLMGQFMEMNFLGDAPGVRQAVDTLRGEISAGLRKGTPEGRRTALHEFVAWSLSNQNLSDALKKSQVRVKLERIVAHTLRLVRKLFGIKGPLKRDMFSAIQRNAGALIVSAPDGRGKTFSSALNQVSGKSSDSRLASLMQAFDQKIGLHLEQRDARYRDTENLRIYDLANTAANTFAAHGFPMDPQQTSAFRTIQAALASTMEFDRPALVRVQRIFADVMGDLTVEDLMQDPESTDPSDRYQAQERFNVLTGKYGAQRDGEDRSNRLASFLALSQVHPEFRTFLRNRPLPKDRNLDLSSMDAALESAAEGVMNTLSRTLSGERRASKTADEALDQLSQVLAQVQKDDRTLVEREGNRLLGVGDSWGKKVLSKAGEKLVEFGDAAVQAEHAENRLKTRELIGKSARLLAAAVDENRGKAFATGVQSLVDNESKVPHTIRNLLGEVFGITDENRGVYDLVNRVKYAVSGVRQDYREDLPRILKEKFSRDLSKEEWSKLFLALGKTDIAALGDTFSFQQIRKLLTDPRALRSAIRAEEEAIKKAAPKGLKHYQRKAEELAHYMVHGEFRPGNPNPLRNARAIAMLLGEPKSTQRDGVEADRVEAPLDRLISLYALEKAAEQDLSLVQELAAKESAGVDFLTAYLGSLRAAEAAKPHATEEARLNGYKGAIPSETRSGVRLIVAADADHNSLVSQGFTRIGDYKGSGVERGGKRGYYFSTVSGSSAYNQGVMQTVATSYNGVDPRTGYTVTGNVAGRIPKNLVATTQARLWRQAGRSSNGEVLLPVFNAEGNVIAYERAMAADMLSAQERNTHLGEMIGAWAGRQAEEVLAQDYNRQLVDQLHAVWETQKKQGRKGEFVDLSSEDLDDPIYAEAWKLVPAEMRDYIKEKFGDQGFMIRRSMVENAVGYRQPSVGDAWVGNTRWNEATQKAFRDTATVLLGKNAFKHLVRAEKAIQAGVSVAKNTIVIRSVIVPASNLVSNFLQLATIGVGPRDIYKGYTTKLVEIEQHLRNLKRKNEIRALMGRYRNDEGRMRRLETEMKSLDDSSKRMSIWPLIEAGEFSTISEGLTEADAAISQGSWADWMQDKIEEAPRALGTVGRYAMITRDTALYKGMSRAVQYGDFLAKATMFDHLTKREGLKAEEALKRVSEEFVNYNLLPGRTRSYAESMGLTWFWAFKLRSIKIAHRHMRDNPLRALLATAGAPMLPDLPGVSVGSPITDNFGVAAADGRLGYSMLWGQMWNAPNLNPWVNIAN